MSKLFSPFKIKEVTLKNRIVVSPMCQYSSIDGFATDWHLVHLGSRAVGGAGLVIQEASAVSANGRITYGDLGIWKDEHIEKLSQIVNFIHENGSIAGIQLAHAGRKASCEVPWHGGEQIKEGDKSWQPVAPSEIPFNPDQRKSKELNLNEIKEIISDFVEATKRAVKAGYKVVEIHAAHGYLIQEFLSPLSNQRADEYGGTFENRIRFMLEVLAGVQSVWPSELPLFVRVSATDWKDGGWTADDSVELSRILKEKGVDLIDTSSGGNAFDANIPAAPNYQVSFARKIKQEANIPTGAVGIITEAKQAEAILESEEADLIFIGRESLRQPYFPLHAAKNLDVDLDWPQQYARAKR